MKAINKIWLKGLIEDGNDEVLREMRMGYVNNPPLNPEEKSIVMLIDHYFNSKKELLINIEAEALNGNEHIELVQDGIYASCEPTFKWVDIKGDRDTPGDRGWDIDYGEILFTVDDSLFEE